MVILKIVSILTYEYEFSFWTVRPVYMANLTGLYKFEVDCSLEKCQLLFFYVFLGMPNDLGIITTHSICLLLPNLVAEFRNDNRFSSVKFMFYVEPAMSSFHVIRVVQKIAKKCTRIVR